MAIPAFLRAVNGQIYSYIFIGLPFVQDFLIVYQVISRTRTIDDVYAAVIVLLVPYIVDNRTQRSQADTTGDKQQVFSLQSGFHREAVSVRSTDGNLLSNIHHVQPAGQTATLLDAEFHKFFIGRRRCDGEHPFSDTRYRQHCTLPRNVFKHLFTVQTNDTESLDIWGIHTNICYHTDFRN